MEKHLPNIPQADVRRRERRGVFFGRRHAADLSVDARRLSVRSDLHDEDRRHRRASRQHGHWPDDVRVLLSGRRRTCCSRRRTRRSTRLSAAAELRAWLRLADLRRLRHLSRQRRRLARAADDARPATTRRRRSRRTALIVFTSVRDGDMEIYSMKADGSDVRRLTNRPGRTADRSSRGTASRSRSAAAR